MRLLLVLGLIASSIIVFSQENFKEGYVIKNNHDTIRGYIDYDAKKHFVCRFKKFDTDSIKYFKPFDIIGYRFINDKYFISKKIIIRKSYNKNQEVSYNINEPLSDRYITKTWYDDDGFLDLNVFLEYLIEGKMKIFYFNFNNVDCYFAKNDKDTLIDLTQESLKVYEYGRLFSESKSETYKNKLRGLTKDCPQLDNDLKKIELNHEDLIKVSKDYHNYVCHDNNCIVYEREIKPTEVKISFKGGIGFSGTSKLTLLAYHETEIPLFIDKFSYLFGMDINLKNLFPNRENTSLSFGLYFLDNNYTYFYKVDAQVKSGPFKKVEIESTYKITSVCFNVGVTQMLSSKNSSPYVKIGIAYLRPNSESFGEAPLAYSSLGVNSLNQLLTGLNAAIGYSKKLQNSDLSLIIELQHMQFYPLQFNTSLLVGNEF